MRILGYDPGSRNQGFSILKYTKRSKQIELEYESTLVLKKQDIKDRIAETYDYIQDIIFRFKPDVLVVEKLVMNGKNGSDINKITGVIYLACLQTDIVTYSPNEIKKTITGSGKASKDELASTVRQMLNLEKNYEFNSNHASDATGIGLSYLIKEYNYGKFTASANKR